MARLITSSLVDSISWYRNAPQSKNKKTGVSWKDEAKQQLVNALSRVYPPRTPEQARGMQFEDAVYNSARINTPNGGSEHFKWFVNQVHGGEFQKVFKKIVPIDGNDYCLYAKLDAWLPMTRIIKDLKATGNYKGSEKYLNSFQHEFYCYLADCDYFYYLIAVFENGNNQVADRHIIEYKRKSREILTDIVMATVRGTIAFLESDEQLKDLWLHKFTQW